MGIYALVIPFDTVTWASDEFGVKDYVGYVSLGEVVIFFVLHVPRRHSRQSSRKTERSPT